MGLLFPVARVLCRSTIGCPRCRVALSSPGGVGGLWHGWQVRDLLGERHRERHHGVHLREVLREDTLDGSVSQENEVRCPSAASAAGMLSTG